MVTQVHAAHILVKTEQEAKQLLEEIRSGKMDFGKAAQLKSICPSGKKDGDLGWFGHGAMVREFEQAAFNTPKGQIAGPFKTQFGWHILKVLETR
ncbi:MAG: peptidylprolyl isomerase [Candidatus Aenigmatarchaeota archaeon]